MNMENLWKQIIIPFFSLCTSLGTLLCCALPALFVTFGAGASLAGLVSNVPGLIVLSEHKEVVFIVAGVLLLGTGALRYINRNIPCSSDPFAAKNCTKIKSFSKYIYGFSVAIYFIGFFFAFVAARILY
jgi:hypothetical protein